MAIPLFGDCIDTAISSLQSDLEREQDTRSKVIRLLAAAKHVSYMHSKAAALAKQRIWALLSESEQDKAIADAYASPVNARS